METFLYLFYVACMAAGALVFVAWSRDPRGVPGYEYAVAFFIPVCSGIFYFVLGLGGLQTEVAGQTVHLGRYLDWVVTTPLLLFALAVTAMHYVPKNMPLIAALVGADVLMVLFGMAADLSTSPFARYFLYAMGCVAFVAILYLIWSPLRRIAERQGPELYGVFRRAATLLTVLWIGYPLFWLIGPSGIGAVGPTTDVFLFVALPIFSKVGFSLYDLSELRALKTPGRGTTGRVA